MKSDFARPEPDDRGETEQGDTEQGDTADADTLIANARHQHRQEHKGSNESKETKCEQGGQYLYLSVAPEPAV